MGVGLTRDEYEEEHREKDERIEELERELAELRKSLRRLRLWCEAVAMTRAAREESE